MFLHLAHLALSFTRRLTVTCHSNPSLHISHNSATVKPLNGCLLLKYNQTDTHSSQYIRVHTYSLQMIDVCCHWVLFRADYDRIFIVCIKTTWSNAAATKPLIPSQVWRSRKAAIYDKTARFPFSLFP